MLSLDFTKRLSPRQMDYIAAMFVASANPEIKWTKNYIQTFHQLWKVLSQKRQAATGEDKAEIDRDIHFLREIASFNPDRIVAVLEH